MGYKEELEAVRVHLVSMGHVNIAELLDYYEFKAYDQPSTTFVKFKDHEGEIHLVPTDIDFFEMVRSLPPMTGEEQ